MALTYKARVQSWIDTTRNIANAAAGKDGKQGDQASIAAMREVADRLAKELHDCTNWNKGTTNVPELKKGIVAIRVELMQRENKDLYASLIVQLGFLVR